VTGDRWQPAAELAGALLAGLAVLAGAFGAHALRARLDPTQLALWETAARYQMYHALALLLTGQLLRGGSTRLLRIAGGLFLAGILLFSGSLYALALSGMRWLGAITPVGGAAFLVGWGCLAIGSLQAERS
jgi:uncharacterized membrane protein YgdD (TMEM256/DUF423 family)